MSDLLIHGMKMSKNYIPEDEGKNVKDYPPHLDYSKDRKPPIGAKPGWLCAAQRIAELAGAINRYAEDGHGDSRRILIREWAEEIILQCDIWDNVAEDE